MWSSGGIVLNRALLVTLSLVQLSRASPTVDSGVSKYSFPDDFIFGVSTAAFQIEGGWNEGGRGESIWDTYLHEHPNCTSDHKNGDIADDSYHHWREDIELIKSLGVSGYRMSISWSRILPNGTDNNINQEGVKYYRNIFEELRKANITPLVTLFHWDMPTPLMDLGGWNNPKVIDFFEDYARVVFKLYGHLVKMWLTINEIHWNCMSSYGLDGMAPALNSHGIGVYLCFHYSLLAHARVYRLYEKEFKPHQQGKVSVVLDAAWSEPKDPNKPEDVKAAEDYLQMNLGLLAHPIYSDVGDYPSFVRERIDRMSHQQGYSRSRLPHFSPEEVKSLQGSADFFGLNHYSSQAATPSSMEPEWKVPSLAHDTGVKVEGMGGQTAYPQGFRKLLNWLHNNYALLKKNPIIITENGYIDDGKTIEDYERISYYNKYLNQLLLAIHEDGVKVAGYFAWSLMDDFEWSAGYTIEYGLFHVDYNSPNRTRTPKLSSKNYANIVRTRRVDFDYIKPPSVHKTV